MTRLARCLALATVYAGAAAIAFAGAELYLRRNGGDDRCQSVPTVADVRLGPVPYAREDVDLGWVAAPRGDEVNPQGFRDPRPFVPVGGSSASTRVVVLGDSFMWGAQIEPTESVPRELERILGAGWTVANVSAPGWGLDQMYLAYLRYRDVLRPGVVVLAFIDDDVNRVLETYRPQERLRKPAFRLEGETLVRRPLVNDDALRRALDGSIIARCALREIRRATTARAIATRILRALAAETSARHERLVVVRIPDGITAGTTLRRAWWHLRGSPVAVPGVDYFEPYGDFEDARRAGVALYVADGHLTAAGSTLLAKLLAHRIAPDPTVRDR